LFLCLVPAQTCEAGQWGEFGDCADAYEDQEQANPEILHWGWNLPRQPSKRS